MASRVSVTHDDLNVLEELIRRKETGLPGSKMSPASGVRKSKQDLYKNVEIRPNGKIRMSGSNSPLAMQGQRAIHDKRHSMETIPSNAQSNLTSNLLQQRSQAMIQQGDPYEINIKPVGKGPLASSAQQNIRSSYPNKSNSLGVLPGLNRPIPKGLPSLAEYGNNPAAMLTDSTIIQNKEKRANRLREEDARGPRNKASLGKQFTDEVLSPVKQK